MKTVVTERLTRAYLQKLSRQNYIAATFAALIATISIFWLVFHLGGDKTVILFSDSMYAIASWIGSLWVCITAYRSRYGPVRLEPRHQLAWLVIGIGLLSNGIGDSYYTYLEYIGHLNPVPSLSDVGFTCFYFLTFIGLLLMPTEPKTGHFRLRIALDAIITTLCILGISWYFVIGPIFLSFLHNPAFNHNPLLIPKLIVAVSYPFWDILLILAILLLIGRRTEPVLQSSLLLFGIGILAQICGDTGYAIQIPPNTYQTGTFYIDPFWFIGTLLIGLSARFQYTAIARNAFNSSSNQQSSSTATPTSSQSQRTGTMAAITQGGQSRTATYLRSGAMAGTSPATTYLRQSLLIYIPLVVLLTLMLYSEVTQDYSLLSFFLVVLTAIVGLLVTIRYLLATNENEQLLQEREQRRSEAERLRILTAQLAAVLELDPLLTRIVTLATSDLGFDAAILLLVEEDDHPLSAQSRLLIRATSSHASSETLTWRFQEPGTSECTILTGKETEISWPRFEGHIPTEIRTWQQEQRLINTLFVPLVYQGNILGSLGFCKRSSKPFDEHEKYIVRAFAEQAAIALEHARLYEATHEHEIFSKAMANLAAQLNSFVAEPAEIHQVICREGANALQADYALLYASAENGQMLPLAVYSGNQEPSSTISDWPAIRKYDPESQALTSLQPTLVVFDQLTTGSSLPAVSGKLPSLRESSGRLQAARNQPGRDNPSLYTSASLSAYSTVTGMRERRMSSLRGALIRRSVSTAILAPLIARDQPVGLLILARSRRAGGTQKRSFGLTDLAQAQDFAEQAAIAFTNAHLYLHLSTAHQRLQELDQMKDQFMVTASHELRTPLTSVQGYLELLAEYGEMLSPEQREDFLQKARRSCDELVLLLSNVMDASRLEIEAGVRPAHLESVSVPEMIQSIVDLIEPQLKQERREVRFQIPGPLFVKADPGRLRQVLLNLSVNALKYSPAGTPILFSARGTFDPIPSVIISVSDRGKGIKLQDQALLFQRFVRLESDINSTVRGSGLGLYISRRLIEAMGGRIWVESRGIPGAGSTFSIQLPVA